MLQMVCAAVGLSSILLLQLFEVDCCMLQVWSNRSQFGGQSPPDGSQDLALGCLMGKKRRKLSFQLYNWTFAPFFWGGGGGILEFCLMGLLLVCHLRGNEFLIEKETLRTTCII